MSIIDKLVDRSIWEEFYQYKLNKTINNPHGLEELKAFIDGSGYLDKATSLSQGKFPFGLPEKKIINKLGTDKKRTVYSFATDETYILKLITYLLYKYDNIFADNLYSFRKDKGVKQAIQSVKNNHNCFALKVDVSNYFNSISIPLLLDDLREFIVDQKLLDFFEKLLTQDQAILGEEIITENRGAMAGVPLASFFANVYLRKLDQMFEERQVSYARYSDDIILFAKTQEELDENKELLFDYILSRNLSFNPDKVKIYSPSDHWDFLGFSCKNGIIDLSPISLEKMKGKIRRKCRALYRWKLRKNASSDRAITAAIRSFNRKFFDANATHELSWCRWFFPLLSHDKSLKVIDQYILDHLRYIATGKFTKKNYKLYDYSHLKELGFKSLVNEYWKYKKQQVQ